MKKFTSIILSIVLITSMFTGVSFAETEIKGYVKYVPFGGEETGKAGIEVKIGSDTVETEGDGSFSFDGPVTSASVEDTDEYIGASLDVFLSNPEENILIVKERMTPDESMYEAPAWISEDEKTAEIKGVGYKMGISLTGPFTETLALDVDKGSHDPIYFQDENGEVSKPASSILKVDRTAPVVLNVEASSSDAELKDHGIYGKTAADILVTVTVEEQESGLKGVSLLGDSGTNYPLVSGSASGTTYTATFMIEASSDILTDTLYIEAEDNVGNISQATLLRDNEDASTITLENMPPEASELTVNKAPNDKGWYNSDVIVTAKGKDTDSGLASIKGYVNGEETESRAFIVKKTEDETLEIPVVYDGSESYLVEAVFTDNSGNSVRKSITIKVDTAAPEITITGPSGFIKEAQNIGINIEEAFHNEEGEEVSIAVTKEGDDIYEETLQNAISASISKDIFAEEGPYVVCVTAKDAAGNSSSESLEFTLDLTAPALESKGFDKEPNENGWFDSLVTLSYEAGDTLSGLESVSGKINGSGVTGDGSISITEDLISNDDGEYVFEVTALDKAGNESKITETAKIDTVKPTITLSNIEEAVYQEAPNLNIVNDEKHFEEEGAKIVVSVYMDENLVSKKEYPQSKSESINEFAEDGNYTVKVIAVDAAGNESDEESISFTVDKTNPIIEDKGVSEGEKEWYNSEITFNYGVADETSGVNTITVNVNGKEIDSPDGKVEITQEIINETINDNGTYTVNIKVEDRAGNEKVFARTFKIDTVKPELSVSGASEGGFYSSSPEVNIISNEKHYEEADVVVKISKDGALISETKYTGENDIAINNFKEDGKYILTVNSIDAAGNKANQVEISFAKDSTPPVLTDGGVKEGPPNANGWYSSKITVETGIKDETSGVSGVTAKLNGKDVAINNGTVIISDTLISELANNDGVFTLVVMVKDRAGNERSITRSYKIDIVKPVLTLSGIDEGAHYIPVPSLTVSSNDRHSGEKGHKISVAVTCDGESIYENTFSGTSSTTISPFERDGNYVVTATCVDAAGNRADEKTVSFVRDSTAPVITLSGAEEGKYHSSPVDVVISIAERYFSSATSDVTLTKELRGASTNIPLSFAFTGNPSSLTQHISDTGFYTFSVTARDEAGNIAEEKTLTFYVDAVKPELRIEGVQNEVVYTFNEPVAPIIKYSDDYFDSVTYEITRAGVNWKPNLSVIERNGEIVINNVPQVRDNDGVYMISAKVTDKAGNISEETVSFIINRFGSYFEYPERTNKMNGLYVQNVTQDLSILEYNVTDLKETKEELKLDGKVISAVTSNKASGEKAGYKITEHIFKKESFEAEGVYELNVISKDSSGNAMESKAENGVIRIVVDRTAPTITISGLERYMNADSVIGSLAVTDNLSDEVITSVYINGEAVECIEDTLTFEVGSGSNQEIKVKSIDKAGNEKEETITVSIIPSGFIYTLTKHAAGFIGGGIGLVALAGLLIFLAKKKKDKEEA